MGDRNRGQIPVCVRGPSVVQSQVWMIRHSIRVDWLVGFEQGYGGPPPPPAPGGRLPRPHARQLGGLVDLRGHLRFKQYLQYIFILGVSWDPTENHTEKGLLILPLNLIYPPPCQRYISSIFLYLSSLFLFKRPSKIIRRIFFPSLQRYTFYSGSSDALNGLCEHTQEFICWIEFRTNIIQI